MFLDGQELTNLSGGGLTGRLSGAVSRLLQSAGVFAPDINEPMGDFNREIKDIFLVADASGETYDSCLALTGSLLLLVSLRHAQRVLLSHDYARSISDLYAQLIEGQDYQVEIERIEYCSSNLQLVQASNDELEEGLNAEHPQATLVNLFALVRARRQVPGVYKSEPEIRLAHMQTRVGSNLADEPTRPELLLYDITAPFLQHLPDALTAEANAQTPLLLDACSFTVATSGCSVVMMVGAHSQQGLMVEMDATTSLTNVRAFTKGTGCAKILGLNLSSQDELTQSLTSS